ncbi:Cytochrome c-552 (plasmid) [Pseudoseohaeicola sp. NH-UV-7]|jgi:cytochrome c|uniref:c-type cytochrome n=1 Tax=unclassified Sulfitobacter TaxID=196795 RepID=UPI000E0AB51E|nr:cytochrome c family protein [Sulfitobacter sp. JL08]AXI56722.1 cytochrome c family protein [Sulfitobacter sp. JL08]
MLDTMTFTKIAGGLCAALLIFLLGKWAADILYGDHGHHEQSYVIETGDDEGGEAEEAGPSFDELMASADIEKGAGVFRKCSACHKLEQGANGTGPYLYGVVGREKAAAEGFGYSDVLASMDGAWTPENLDGFLEKPKDYAPGTTMAFAGLKKPQDRADLIAYLDSLDN